MALVEVYANFELSSIKIDNFTKILDYQFFKIFGKK